MSNSWRIVISCMMIWTTIADGDMITVNEFVHLYRLKESKEFLYYEFVPWNSKSRLIVDLPSSFHYWKSRYFFVSGDGWETFSDDFWGDVSRLLRRWETPLIGVFAPHKMLFSSLTFGLYWSSDLFLLLYFAVKERPELESKFEERVQAAIKYARRIDDFDELIDLRTLARHCLGREPSLYVLSTLDREERKRKLPLHMGSSYLLFLRLNFLFSLV